LYNGCFKNLDTPEKTYWFGFIVGDGSIGVYHSNQYEFSATLKEKDHLEKLALFLGYPLDRVKVTKIKYYRLKVNCKELVLDLMNLGLAPRKSHTVNDKIIPLNYQWNFIRGLMDADGSIYLNNYDKNKALNPGLSFAGNYPLLMGLQKIINDGGHLRECKSKHKKSDELSYGGRIKVERILDKIYCSEPYLCRKYNLYKIIKDYGYNHVPHQKLIRKYDIYKGKIAYLERTCLYCGDKFLVIAGNVHSGKGIFCSKSHSMLYYWKLRKEGVNTIAITGSYATR
jgi:intein/homing endonuclease